MLIRQLSEVNTQLGEMQSGNLLVELLWQRVDTELVVLRPQRDLSQNLVGEAGGHDERGVTGGTAKVDESSLSEEDDTVSVGEGELVDLRLDFGSLDAGVVLQSVDVDFVVKVTDVADDGVVSHLGHVLYGQNVSVSGGGDEDLGSGQSVLDSVDFVTSHGSLEGTDGVDLGDDDTSSLSSQRLSRSLSDISVTADDGNL